MLKGTTLKDSDWGNIKLKDVCWNSIMILDKIFSGNRLCQLWIKAHFRGSIIIPVMMETEMVSETLGFCPQLTWLFA
jgi:hypothetical protein